MSQYSKILTVKEAKDDFRKIPTQLVYAEKPLVIINDDGVVLWTGDLFDFENTVSIKAGYYDKCFLCVREHDLYLNNNDKVSQYPECAKLDKHSAYINSILEFIEFAAERGVTLSKVNSESGEVRGIWDLDFPKAQTLLYEMFSIDEARLEKERNAMLAALQG